MKDLKKETEIENNEIDQEDEVELTEEELDNVSAGSHFW